MTERPPRPRLALLAIAYVGFISLGLPDTLIGVAWPSVRDHFHLPQGALAFVFFGAGCSYFLSSFFVGRLLKVLRIGTLLAASSALVALSGFGFGAAQLWLLFAACSLLHGLGSGAIDAGLNHYVAHHFPARHMNWLHACYSIGAMLGPLIMTALIAWQGSWRAGYFTVAVILLSLSLLFAATRRKWDEPEESPAASDPAAPTTNANISGTLGHPLVRLHVALFFVYTGLEVTIGQWSFTVLTESRNVAKETAGLFVTIYWGSIAVGRVLFGFIVEWLGLERLIRLSLLAALLGSGLFAIDISAAASAIALCLIGLGLAAVFPCMMTRTPQRLGKSMAAHAIGFQVGAAMLGAASLPSLSGILAQQFGLGIIAPAAVAMAVLLLLLNERVLVASSPAVPR